MNDIRYKKCMLETINFLVRKAIESKKTESSSKESLKAYAQGMVMGYYSIINLLKYQSYVFCIDLKELGLNQIDPDIELLGLHKNPNIDFGEKNWNIEPLNGEKVKSYFIDTINLIKNQAVEAKKEAEKSNNNSMDYEKGELMAYCVFISFLKKQIRFFNLNQSELGMLDGELECFNLSDKEIM